MMTLRDQFKKEVVEAKGSLTSLEEIFLTSDQYYIPWLEAKIIAAHDRVADVVLSCPFCESEDVTIIESVSECQCERCNKPFEA